jgi:hypothetical protein
MPTGEQKQKKRTIHALPKPDNFIRYRQKLFTEASSEECTGRAIRARPMISSVGQGVDWV